MISLMLLEFINSEEALLKRQAYREYVFYRTSNTALSAEKKHRLDHALSIIADIAIGSPLGYKANNTEPLHATQSLLNFVELFVLPAIECHSH